MVYRGKVGNSQHFPTNLHILLDEAEKAGHSHIISWCAQGQSFKIHDQDAMVPLLAKYFRQTKFKSFLRQLQSYGFNRTTRGCDKGVVSHPYFVRGRRSLCFRMARKPTGCSQAAMRQQGNSSENLSRALPTNPVQPIRKIQSAPVGFQNAGLLQNSAPYTDMSKLKNASFDLNHTNVAGQVAPNLLQSMSYYQGDKVHAFNPTKSVSATALFYCPKPTPPNTHNIQKGPNPAASMSSQRDGIHKCGEIDYRPDLTQQTPNNGFLLSIEESTSVPTEVPSQQHQFSFQVQQGQHQEPVPLHALQQPQDQQVHQVIQVPQNSQVHIQKLQYQHHAPQQQVCVQYCSEPQRQTQQVTYTKYEMDQVQPQEVIPQADQVYSLHQSQTEKVYSQQEVAEKVEQAKEDIVKHFREQLLSNKLQAQYSQQDQQPVMQHSQVVQQEVPQSDNTCLPNKTMYASAPSNNFELSFSTSEFTNTSNNGAVVQPKFPSLPKYVPSNVESNSNFNGTSFSVAITTPTLAMRPTPRVHTDAFRNASELCPINIENIESNNHFQRQPLQPESAQVDSIDEGTVDFLLQTGSGGCDEWEMPAEEVAEGLNFYGFSGTATESCHQQPIVANGQYNRQ